MDLINSSLPYQGKNLLQFKSSVFILALSLGVLLFSASAPLALGSQAVAPMSVANTLTLQSPIPQYFGTFGLSTATNGRVAVVGAYIESVPGLTGGGHAYIFNTTNGNVLYALTSPNAEYIGAFGFSVAMSG